MFPSYGLRDRVDSKHKEETMKVVKARDDALGHAFKVLRSANGELPPAGEADSWSTIDSYIDDVERNCIRELFGLIHNWRAPDIKEPDKWRDWPMKEKDPFRAECYESLLLLGSIDDRDSITLRLQVAHPAKKELLLSGESALLREVLGASKSVQSAERTVRNTERAVGEDIVFTVVGYVGDLTSALLTCQLLRNESEPRPLLQSLHGMRRSAIWQAPQPLNSERTVPLNHSQHAALSSLESNVELISGPPGTGKSTTIHALVTECIPEEDAVILTAVQNRAIEALVDKFARTNTPFIVHGSRLTGVALQWTLDAQCNRNPIVAGARNLLKRANTLLKWLSLGLQINRERLLERANAHSSRQRKRKDYAEALMAAASEARHPGLLTVRCGSRVTLSVFGESAEFVEWLQTYATRRRKKHGRNTPRATRELNGLVASYMETSVNPFARFANGMLRKKFAIAFALQAFLEGQAQEALQTLSGALRKEKLKLTTAAKALLCTSAAVGPALRNDDLKALVNRATTLVGDEAGNIADRHMLPSALNCPNACRLVLVGGTNA